MPDNPDKIHHYRTCMRMYGEMMQDLSHSEEWKTVFVMLFSILRPDSKPAESHRISAARFFSLKRKALLAKASSAIICFSLQ